MAAITFDDLDEPKGGVITFDDLEAPPTPSGFGRRMAEDYGQRVASTKAAQDKFSRGEIGNTRLGLRQASQTAGLVGDLAGNILGSAARYAGDLIPDSVLNAGKDAGISLLNRASDSAVGDLARSGAAAYKNIKQQYPETVQDASDLLNLGGFVLGAGPVKNAGSAAVNTTGKVALRGAEKLSVPKQVMPNSEQLAAMGREAYEVARASGEMFDAPSVSNKFVAALEAAKPRKIAGAVETDLSQALESSLGKYRQLVDKPLGIDEIDIIDKDLSNLKDQAYSAGKNQLGAELSNIQNALRGSVSESASGKDLAKARDLFRRKYQMEDVERIFRNAEGRPNEAAIIQTGYRNLANQARKKGSGYTKQQIMLMDKAAKGGLSIDALKLLSSKLIPIAAGASSGGAAAGVAFMGNLAAGAGATALQTAKANKLAKSITKGVSVNAEPTMINRAAQKIVTIADRKAAFEAKKKRK